MESARNLALNIRQLRESRGLTQAHAARLARMPRPTWGNLESGSANPTLSVLLQVASVLRVSIEELVGSPRAEGKLTPAAQLKTHKRGEVVIRKILPDALPGCELDRIELPPGAHMVGVPHRSGTREYLTCERGSIKVAVQGETWTLAAGDVLAFRGDQKHSYQNVGTALAVGYSTVLLSPT